MLKLTYPLFAMIVVALAACALPGKMYSLNDGTESAFEIQRSSGTGGMTAHNPKTGERFTGQYTATAIGGGTSRIDIDLGGTKSGTGTVYTPPSYANARGILRGDKGTVISVYLDIRPGLRPTGHGEGVENIGNRYQFQF